ncbi:hypothetical protein ES703_107593 [subsurface metagenome]
MPVIKVSNETYQLLLRKQAEDGNAMSVVMDRLMANMKDLEDGKNAPGKTRSGGSKRRKPKKRASHPEPVSDEIGEFFGS